MGCIIDGSSGVAGLLFLSVRWTGLGGRRRGQQAFGPRCRDDARDAREPRALGSCDGKRLLVGLSADSMVARVRRAVGVAAAVEDLVHRVSEREHDGAPVAEGVVERMAR